MTHEHSEDDEGDQVGVGELEHPQQRDEDGLAGDVDDAADAVIVRILNGAPVKPVWIKAFSACSELSVHDCTKTTVLLILY